MMDKNAKNLKNIKRKKSEINATNNIDVKSTNVMPQKMSCILMNPLDTIKEERISNLE